MGTSLSSLFDRMDLDKILQENKNRYQEGKPFPHIVMDDFLPEDVLHPVISEFPGPDQIAWTRFENPAEKKLASTHEKQLRDHTRMLLYQLNSSIFLTFLEQLTGIEGLIPDPHFWGGGLHQIQRGGFLKVHADFNHHPRLKLDRRLNLLVYLNEDWKEEYGGHLELWDATMSRCEARVLPIFNRCVIFSTTDFSYHGHPDPLTCPEGRSRRSLALYYYSNGRPQSEVSGAHNTLFRERPGEEFLEAAYGRPAAPPAAEAAVPVPQTHDQPGGLKRFLRRLVG